MASVEGTLVAILEPGVQEVLGMLPEELALCEKNIDQTVTSSLAINVLEYESTF